MATRIKDWMIPYTWGIGIEITDNHIINVLLRAMNNLIHYTWEDDPEYDGPKELYVDLQLPDWITPEDDFPVWVTVWEILAEDWWQQSGTILNWKTTSWDWVRIIYANDDTLYYDPWTWVWIPFLTWDKLDVATASKLWVIKLGSDTKQTEPAQNPSSATGRTYPVQLNANNQAMVNVPWEDTTYESLIEEQWWTDESLVTTGEKYIWNHKQDKLIAWDNITIDQNNKISANITAMTFKGSVPDYSSLPTTWNNVWDVWVIEDTWIAYCWDGTDWVSLGSFIDLSNYFNKTVDDSDDIVQGTLNLFVSPAEKATWNNKQDKLIPWINITINADWRTINAVDTTYTEGEGINITNDNVIENTLPFDPENEGSLWQTLKRTSTWYRWADEASWWEYEEGDWIDITWNVISNTKPFDPLNRWQLGQVLKRATNWYYWATEWGWGWGWDSDAKIFDVVDIETAQEAINYFNTWKLAILRVYRTVWYMPKQGEYLFYPVIDSISTNDIYKFHTIPTSNDIYIESNWVVRHKYPTVTIYTNNWTVTSIDLNGYTIAEREDVVRMQNVTAAEYEQITPVTGVVYNILPNS